MQIIESGSSERVKVAVRLYVRSRKTDFPISMAELIRRVRYAIPDIEGTDRDLADMVAREIVEAGGNISFDMDPAEMLAQERGSKAGAPGPAVGA